MSIATINPFTGQKIKDFEALSLAEIHTKITQGYSTFQAALANPEIIQKRKQTLVKVAEILEKNAKEFGTLMTLEVGRTIKSSQDEVLKCAKACRFYAENAETFLKSDAVTMSDQQSAQIHYLPLGVILAVMPWNFPFWQVFRCAAPILLSGNSMVLKHASNVPQCALTIEEIFRQAGLEEGAFQTLLIGSDQVEEVIKDHQILAVTLTGSGGAGSKVASMAGKHIKKTVLELGGSDPFIVMPSSDLEKAAETAVKARMIANGQSCIAAKRFLVHEDIYDDFKKLFLKHVANLKLGDPMLLDTDLGPLATAAIRNDLQELVTDAVDLGADLLTGGSIPDGPGFFYPPTILESIPMNARIYQEEAFGPVASFYRIRDVNDAIEVANSTPFGLGASIWTQNAYEVEQFSREVQSGQVFFNAMVASDPRIPFGGVKASGYGRELGTLGAREFCNIKSIVFSGPVPSRP